MTIRTRTPSALPSTPWVATTPPGWSFEGALQAARDFPGLEHHPGRARRT